MSLSVMGCPALHSETLLSLQSTVSTLKAKALEALGLDPLEAQIRNYWDETPHSRLEGLLDKSLEDAGITTNQKILLQQQVKL
jgi:hypothetical protein